jgi:hypothetical protein
VAITHDPTIPHVEPSIAVNPTNPANLLAGSQILQASPTSAAFVSFDSGQTWDSLGGLPQSAADITIAFGPSGQAYICSEAYDAQGQRGVGVYVSSDGGRTIDAPKIVSQSGNDDHPWMDVGRSGTESANDVFVVWNSGDLVKFARSTDSGATFEPEKAIATATAPSGPARACLTLLATGASNHVYAAYCAAPAGGGRQSGVGLVVPFYVVASSDAGASFGSPNLVTTGTVGIDLPQLPSESTQPALGADPVSGTLYFAAVVATDPASSDIVLWTSQDDGRSWAGPEPVNDPSPTGTFAIQPRVATAGGGLLYVSYLSVAGGGAVMRLASSKNAAPFSNRTVSTAPFDPTLSTPPLYPGPFIGDYQGLATFGSSAFLVWNDTRDGAQAQLYFSQWVDP